jgi:hypothetical protein
MITFTCPNCKGEHAKTREDINTERDDGAVGCWCGFQFQVLDDGSTYTTHAEAIHAWQNQFNRKVASAKAADEAIAAEAAKPVETHRAIPRRN